MAWVGKVRHAGAVFVGVATSVAFGDYLAGPSHVLPTAGTARFASGLSVHDFVRRTSLVMLSAEKSRELAEIAAVLADAEGLPAHAQTLRLRRSIARRQRQR
jgi:histidinol dehydrogenase